MMRGHQRTLSPGRVATVSANAPRPLPLRQRRAKVTRRKPQRVGHFPHSIVTSVFFLTNQRSGNTEPVSAIVGPSTARLEPRQARKGATVEKSGCDGPFPFCASVSAHVHVHGD